MLMTFQEAMKAVEAGKCVRRAGWVDPVMIVTAGATVGDDFPAEAIYSVEGADDLMFFPWRSSAEDQDAVDWELINWSREKGFEE